MLTITAAAILKSGLYGLALAAADQAAITVSEKKDRKTGLKVWLLLVLAPLVLLLCLEPAIAVGAALIATLLSGVAFWGRRLMSAKRFKPHDLDCDF